MGEISHRTWARLCLIAMLVVIGFAGIITYAANESLDFLDSPFNPLGISPRTANLIGLPLVVLLSAMTTHFMMRGRKWKRYSKRTERVLLFMAVGGFLSVILVAVAIPVFISWSHWGWYEIDTFIFSLLYFSVAALGFASICVRVSWIKLRTISTGRESY